MNRFDIQQRPTCINGDCSCPKSVFGHEAIQISSTLIRDLDIWYEITDTLRLEMVAATANLNDPASAEMLYWAFSPEGSELLMRNHDRRRVQRSVNVNEENW